MAQDRNSDEELVCSFDDQERIAALNRDVSALERLWSEQFTVDAPNNQVVVGKSAVLDTFVRAGVINFSTYERLIEFIRADGAFVIIMGLETVQPVSDAPSAGLVAGQAIKRRFFHQCLEKRSGYMAAVCASRQCDPGSLISISNTRPASTQGVPLL